MAGARTPDSWEDVEEALANGEDVRDGDGDLIVRLDEHSNGPDWRRCIYVSKRDEDNLNSADRSSYAQEAASLSEWVVWSEARVSDADVAAALASITGKSATLVLVDEAERALNRLAMEGVRMTDDLRSAVMRALVVLQAAQRPDTAVGIGLHD